MTVTFKVKFTAGAQYVTTERRGYYLIQGEGWGGALIRNGEGKDYNKLYDIQTVPHAMFCNVGCSKTNYKLVSLTCPTAFLAVSYFAVKFIDWYVHARLNGGDCLLQMLFNIS